MLRTGVSTMLPIVWMLAFMVMAAAQPRCDPITQYEKNGECCKMCPPGTRMPSPSSCLDPQCAECGDNEYRDKYTTEPICLRQPYCDPNRNFEVVVPKSKNQRSTCMCKEGFHCSSAECITCVPHTTCEPGYGARSKGNHTHDTVCQMCAEGTFSDVVSWDGVCRGWTECTDGDRVKRGGTGVSDVSCEAAPRTRLGLIIGGSVVGALLVGLLSFCLCKGYAKGKMKVIVIPKEV